MDSTDTLRFGSHRPDVMNDPAFATNTDAANKGLDDPDTCRICRGEGSEEEPLFYPCKCSGSIKFVHQSCLMEWLSHSQKKYCELCKTTFRFTKIYDPEMPAELPAPIFIKKLAIHAMRTLVTWLRFILVTFVWLGWLPWSMRAIWRALFWLADGHWPTGDATQTAASASASASITSSRLAQAATGTSPALSLASSQPSGATAAQTIASVFPRVLSPVSAMFNYTSGEPLMLTFVKRIFLGVFAPSIFSSLSNTNTSQVNLTANQARQRQPSWLSDVSFLNTLTSSPTVNNIVIDTLEGQLITLLVVVSFILVFLIREWVVQQQPAPELAEDERDAVVQLVAGNRQIPVPETAEVEEREDRLVEERLEQDEGQHDDLTNNETTDPARYEASRTTENIPSPNILSRQSPLTPENDFNSNIENFQRVHGEPSTPRPILQSRNALDDASAIHRTLEETSSGVGGQAWPGLETFKDLWTRGEGNPERVLQIIQEEGRQEELGWVVSAMTRLQRTTASQNSDLSPPSLPASSNLGFQNSTSSSSSAARPERKSDIIELPTFSEIVDEETSSSANRTTTFWSDDQSSSSQFVGGGGSLHNFTFVPEGLDTSELPNNPFRAQVENRPSHETTRSEVEPSNASLNPDIIGSDFESIPTTTANSTEACPAESSPPAPSKMTDRIVDWLWGDIAPSQTTEDIGEDDEHIIEDPALEAPFVPVQNRNRVDNAQADANEPENPLVRVAAEGEPNEGDAVDDGDDLEGILELIGMQGPIFGLLQNGVFSALLISFNVAIGIWLPYLWGKIALVFLTSPVQLFLGVPLALLSITADVIIDTLIGSVGYLLYWSSFLLRLCLRPIDSLFPVLDWVPQLSLTTTSVSLIDSSSHRLKMVIHSFFNFHESDLPLFSVLSHRALRIHEARIIELVNFVSKFGRKVFYDLPSTIRTEGLLSALSSRVGSLNPMDMIKTSRQFLRTINGTSIVSLAKGQWDNANLNSTTSTIYPSLEYDLARWDTKDRVIAIIVGYIFASVLAMLYLRLAAFISGTNRGQRVEGVVADLLHQAGGVMKVILIIGIEMIIFPLYCGLLLDLALLPLFENATLQSRIEFTTTSPLTSLFVHWFVGTCYMFHFALFVSMCRKIMRNGVLYFIRDPDDPTFHPVRDVLERNIVTQLRKIAFSALVYGALVIICLGGVVWGLASAFDGVLPIHWSSNIPMLEFPVDLLFYNFVMPFAIRSVKPSDGLHSMYDWWFHRCARLLRLSDFLFGDRHPDEEGYHVRRTWRDLFSLTSGDTEHPVVSEHHRLELEKRGVGVYFMRDGKFVRTPASDQVRIPKGTSVFLEVDENNERIDGAIDSNDGLHGKENEMFTKVYIPPCFRLRIALFILMIWIFAAVTGVSLTIVPLVIGRRMISSFFPGQVRINDLYAFSVGLYAVGGIVYGIYTLRTRLRSLGAKLQPVISSPRQTIATVFKVVLLATRLVFVAVTFALILPSLFALLTELYVLIPLHTYLSGDQPHIIHFIQDWTLGVLYVQMAFKVVQWRPQSRPALALNAIVRDGWLRPNANLATRALLLPTVFVALVAVFAPLLVGMTLNLTMFYNSASFVQSQVYRYSYPASLLSGLLIWSLYFLRRQVDVWRANIRDDVYLMGERLHNFGEKKARDVGVHRRVITS